MEKRQTLSDATRGPSTMRLTPVTEQPAQADAASLIAAIREFNPAIDAAFLAQFDAGDLAEYLDRLESARRKERLIAGWVRPRTNMRLAS